MCFIMVATALRLTSFVLFLNVLDIVTQESYGLIAAVLIVKSDRRYESNAPR